MAFEAVLEGISLSSEAKWDGQIEFEANDEGTAMSR